MEKLRSFISKLGRSEEPKIEEALHKHTESKDTHTDHLFTSHYGQPAQDVSHSLQVGGFVLANDVALMEKQQYFNRSKIPERRVHACGAGAFGYFETTKDVSAYTKAKFLNQVGKRTPVFVRFSTVTYGREFPDSGRNPRGFAIKFYTEEGNYDLVGLNFPIFFVRDGGLGPDVIKSQYRNPKNFLLDFDALFDFMACVPESLHCGTMFFSDRGTPFGFRRMPGFGCHTFRWVNDAGESVYIKYHFIPPAVKNFDWDAAVRMSGEDPDFAKRDLYEHLDAGNTAEWKACIQIMPESDLKKLQFDPFDVTQVWPKSLYPLHEFGRLVLNSNPSNYHRDVEQAAFSPGSMVPGIEPSPDPLLNFRMFFYRDTQLYRLGVNLHQIPVNAPLNQPHVHPLTGPGDGKLRTDENAQCDPAYFPNSVGGPRIDPAYNWKPIVLPQGATISRSSSSKAEGCLDREFAQVRELYGRVMSDEDRAHLHYNIAMMLKHARREIQLRALAAFAKVNAGYAKGIIAKMPDTADKVTWEQVESMQYSFCVDQKQGYKVCIKPPSSMPGPYSASKPAAPILGH